MINLDARLSAIAQLVPHCDTIADIGTDHGKLPAFLLKSGVAKNAVLCDISGASLSKARALFAQLSLSATFVCADGLTGLTSSVDTIIIAGMGAHTMMDILAADLNGATLVLQANKDVEYLREFLVKRGYVIVEETLIRSARRWYVALKAVPGQAQYTESELLAGPMLPKRRDEHFYQYVTHRLSVDTIARKERNVAIWREILKIGGFPCGN